MIDFQCRDILGNSGRTWPGRLRHFLRCGNVFIMVVEALDRHLAACISVSPFGLLVSFPAAFCCHPILDARMSGVNAEWMFNSLGSDVMAVTLAFALEKMADAFPAVRAADLLDSGRPACRAEDDFTGFWPGGSTDREYYGEDFIPF